MLHSPCPFTGAIILQPGVAFPASVCVFSCLSLSLPGLSLHQLPPHPRGVWGALLRLFPHRQLQFCFLIALQLPRAGVSPRSVPPSPPSGATRVVWKAHGHAEIRTTSDLPAEVPVSV